MEAMQDGVTATLQLTRITAGPGPGAAPLFVPGLDAWDGLSLEYRVPWPLHLLLTPQVRGLRAQGLGHWIGWLRCPWPSSPAACQREECGPGRGERMASGGF